MGHEEIEKKILDVMQIEIRSKPPKEALMELFLLRNFIFWCKPEDLEVLKIMLKKASAQHYVKHHVGELNEMVQRCVLCGEIINDYRNAMWPQGQPAPTGFASGSLFISNGKMYCPTIGEYDTFENCTP